MLYRSAILHMTMLVYVCHTNVEYGSRVVTPILLFSAIRCEWILFSSSALQKRISSPFLFCFALRLYIVAFGSHRSLEITNNIYFHISRFSNLILSLNESDLSAWKWMIFVSLFEQICIMSLCSNASTKIGGIDCSRGNNERTRIFFSGWNWSPIYFHVLLSRRFSGSL